LEQEDFEPNLRPIVHSSTKPVPYVRQWPFLYYLIANIPEYVFFDLESDLNEILISSSALAKRLSQDMKTFLDYMDVSMSVLVEFCARLMLM